jgi:hypothetical protein
MTAEPRSQLNPEDLHRLLAAEDYRGEDDFLEDDRPRAPFEPGDYVDDRRR